MHGALGYSVSGLRSEHDFPTFDYNESRELCATDVEARFVSGDSTVHECNAKTDVKDYYP